jgi:hypothetical protein
MTMLRNVAGSRMAAAASFMRRVTSRTMPTKSSAHSVRSATTVTEPTPLRK